MYEAADKIKAYMDEFKANMASPKKVRAMRGDNPSDDEKTLLAAAVEKINKDCFSPEEVKMAVKNVEIELKELEKLLDHRNAMTALDSEDNMPALDSEDTPAPDSEDTPAPDSVKLYNP